MAAVIAAIKIRFHLITTQLPVMKLVGLGHAFSVHKLFNLHCPAFVLQSCMVMCCSAPVACLFLRRICLLHIRVCSSLVTSYTEQFHSMFTLASERHMVHGH
jgi:hypothetical protein